MAMIKCSNCDITFIDKHPGRIGNKFCCRECFRKYKKIHGCGNKGKKWEETYSPETLKIMRDRTHKRGKLHFNYLTEDRKKELLIKHALSPRHSKDKFIQSVLKRHHKLLLFYEIKHEKPVTGRTIFNIFFNPMKSKETKKQIIQDYKNNPEETIKKLFDSLQWAKIYAYQRKAYDKYGRKCDICFQTEGQIDVHHLDFNHKNNKIENLQVLCASCHGKLHKRNQTTTFK